MYGWSHAVDLYHLKIWDSGRQIWTPGESDKFRVNPRNPGVVGKYAIISPSQRDSYQAMT